MAAKITYFLKVPFGIQPKNEANIKEMAEILDALNTYIPEKGLLDVGEIHKIPRVIYGDQLTVACIRGAVTLKSPDIVEKKKLNGFTEVISDWHTRLCLVTISSLYFVYIMHVYTW